MRKKLIEVALPLEAINEASAREKSIRHGHPSTLHLWWARRPLAAARAVIFSSLVDDPDAPDAPPEFVAACRELPIGKNAREHDTPRMRLFDFIELLVKWESTTNEAVLDTARRLIRLATNDNPPPLLDPFAGGGSIPLEAQRLGLEAHASDLNPVAVMINKAQIEIPPRFANQPPVNPRDRHTLTPSPSPKKGEGSLWKGAAGLAADVRYYGEWMRDRAWEKIGHLYPKHNGGTVIAWIWARTVKSPNPAINAHVPLVRSFELSKKKGRNVWIEPQVIPLSAGGEGATHTIRFEIHTGEKSHAPEGTVNRRGATCLISGEPMPFEYIRAEGKAGRMGAMLMAIVTEGQSGRNYYAPTEEHIQTAQVPIPDDAPDTDLPEQALGFRVQLYGMTRHRDLFTPRQLTALCTFSDLVAEAREQTYNDAIQAGLPDDEIPLRDGGKGARAYAEAVSVYLTFGVDRTTDRSSVICSWDSSPKMEALRNTFARQAIPMTWDFAEGNPFSSSSGNWLNNIDWVVKAIALFDSKILGFVQQVNATDLIAGGTVISTDPPYYDNIGYADLSDFFYVWMRKSLREVYPDIFGTLLVPKEPELIASPYRHNGSKEAANQHFESGLHQTFRNIRKFITLEYPLTVYYAFKQQDSESEDDEETSPIQISSTGWETMLTSIVEAGFSMDGTWPMRTELSNRTIASGTNALASSIVLVCRPRPDDAPSISRREFLALLRRELPAALKELQSGNIAPVDLAQASIGPGMAVYSRYTAVLEADGTPMSVRMALGLINLELDAYLAEQDGDIDGDTRFAVAWFEQFGFHEGEFGQADVLARAKNTSVAGVESAGLVESGKGKVKLKHWLDYDPGAWNPKADKRPTIWEAVHHLIANLSTHGDKGAAHLLLQMPSEMAGEARSLAYRLYSICERKGWADHARDYNNLVVLWVDINDQAQSLRQAQSDNQATDQPRLFE